MDNKNRDDPPKSRVTKAPRDREPGSVISAVLLGSAIDIGGSILVYMLFTVIYGVLLATQGQSEQQIEQALKHIDPFSTLGLLITLCGLVTSGVGGFICARTANVNSYTAVGIVSAISVAIGALDSTSEYDWPVLLLLNLMSLAAIFFGGWFYIRKLPTH